MSPRKQGWTAFSALLSLILLSLLAGVAEEPEAAQAIKPTHEWQLSQLSLRGLAFFPDGRKLLTGRGVPFRPEELMIWDIATEKDIAHKTRRQMAIDHLTLSSNATLAATVRSGGKVTLLEAETLNVLATFDGGSQIISAVAFSPDGRYLASSGDKVVKVWDTKTLKEVAHLTDFSRIDITALVFSPDGKRLIVGDSPGIIWVYDTANYMERRKITLPKDERSTTFAFTPGGKYMALTVTGPDPENPSNPEKPREGGVSRMGLVDLASGKEVVTGERYRGTSYPGEHLGAVVVTPDGKFVVAASMNGKVRIMDAQSGKTVVTFPVGEVWVDFGTHYSVRHLAISPDGKILATGGDDGYVRLWNLAEILRPHRR